MNEKHWDDVYTSKAHDDVSWYEAVPATSIRLVTKAASSGHVIDIGAGASTLADKLVELRYDVTVLDLAASAIDAVRKRLGDRATYLVTDLLSWKPATAAYDAWHDRAVFHFLTNPDDQAAYVDLAATAIRPGGGLVLATFAPDGPTACSGLPTARHNAASLEAIFARGLACVSSEREEHVTPWGAVQPLTWVTLRRRD